jgi:hypothetical protein
MTGNDKALALVALVLASIGGYYLMKKTGVLKIDVSNELGTDQQSVRDVILNLAAHDYADHAAFLLAEALTESSFNPKAKSSSSYGLFQIQHTPGFSWLRYFGYSDADVERLFDPTFNTNMAIRIFRYFERKGFVFPDQADIYYVGETLWAKGERNAAYQKKVADYTAQFSTWISGMNV